MDVNSNNYFDAGQPQVFNNVVNAVIPGVLSQNPDCIPGPTFTVSRRLFFLIALFHSAWGDPGGME